MSYIAKYLTKQLMSGPGQVPISSRGRIPKYFQRVRWSKSWCVWTRSDGPTAVDAWWIADVGQADAALDAHKRGYRVTELVVAATTQASSGRRIVRWLRSLTGYRPFALPVAWTPG